MSDPYELFDPEAAAALRGIFDHEMNQLMKPFEEERANRAFLDHEARVKAVYGKTYDENRAAILNFAVANNILDLDLAVRAWRGSQPDQNAASATSTAQPQADENRDDKIADPQFMEWDRMNRKARKQSDGRDAMDEAALKMLKDANGPDALRREITADYNSARDARTTEGAVRSILGHEGAPRVSREESRARMDLEAIRQFRGGKAEPVNGPTREERESDRNGLSDLEQRFSDALAADNQADREAQ